MWVRPVVAAPDDHDGDDTDSYIGDGEILTYSLSGVDANSFTIERAEGQIKVGVGTKLDHEDEGHLYRHRHGHGPVPG